MIPIPPVAVDIAASALPDAAVWPAGYVLAEPEDLPGVPNYGEVIPGILYRSGMQTYEGLRLLNQKGIKTLVNLIGEYNGRTEIEAAGLKYVWLPTPDHQPLNPDHEAAWLSLVADPANWPILVSCHEGSGRTGYACALVRWAFDAMPFPDIRRETRRFRVPHIALALRILGWLDPAQKRAFNTFLDPVKHPPGYLRCTVPAERSA